ncbi:hypothetical protein [Amycolatopsis sp. WAC 01375]|uniref:hypothetical protein n=1 Tax=Amycolatopsis sp. WAC 01375 TaxID=2203194 RepID=UPI000F7A854F|nr:hypothetical protein [Amycolatopsis sp. WAC 01375]
MTVSRSSRNHGARPGYALHDAIDLAGWGDRSIWGWDDGIGSFYAQLWRNGSSSDAPDIWLSGASKPYPWPGCVALDIVQHTGAAPLSVVQALGIADPVPRLRDTTEITQQIDELKPLDDTDGYIGGQLYALAWTQGIETLSPSTRGQDDHSRPAPDRVDAEHHLITGRVYLGGDAERTQAFYSGADEALWWALGR